MYSHMHMYIYVYLYLYLSCEDQGAPVGLARRLVEVVVLGDELLELRANVGKLGVWELELVDWNVGLSQGLTT